MEAGHGRPLPYSVVIAYGLPAVSFGAVSIMVGVYLVEFYSDHLGVPLSQIGGCVTALQIFDAVSDPFIGLSSDRCQSRFGRRRPFVLVGKVFMAAAFTTAFSPPVTLSEGQLLIWMSAVGLLMFLSWTIARVPWMSWGIELTSVHDEKTIVSLAREVGFVTGAVLAAALPTVLTTFELLMDEALRLSLLAAFWGFWGCIAGFYCFLAVPDPPRRAADLVYDGSMPAGSIGAHRTLGKFMRQIIGNRTAMVFYFHFVIYSSGMGVGTLLYPFFVKHVLKREDLVSVFIGMYIIIGALGIPVWYSLSTRLEKKPLYMGALVIQIVCLLAMFFMIDAGGEMAYGILMCFGGTALGGAAVLKFSILSDVADVECLHSGGHRDEGKLFGLFDVSTKLVASGATAACFAVVDRAGYVEGAETQEAGAKLAIRICYAIFPAGSCAVALGVLCFYRLDRAGHAAVLEELAQFAGPSDKVVLPTDNSSAGSGGHLPATTVGNTTINGDDGVATQISDGSAQDMIGTPSVMSY